MDEIMERFALEGETLGFFSWISGKGWSKPTSVSAQYSSLRNEINALIAKVNQKKARLQQLRGQMKTAAYRRPTPVYATRAAARAGSPIARTLDRMRAQQAAARAALARATMARAPSRALTASERAAIQRRMGWGWAGRPGAPDRPGEAAAKRANYEKYKRDLYATSRAAVIRKRRQGWAGRPGAPDRPGEAAAKMRRAGVYLGDDTLEALDEELLL